MAWISTYDDQRLKIGDRITYEIKTTNSPTNRTGDRNYNAIEISPEGEIISFNENGAFIGFTFDIYKINKVIFNGKNNRRINTRFKINR